MSRSRRARLLQAAAVRPRKHNRTQKSRIRSASDFLQTPPDPENTNVSSSKVQRQQFFKRDEINISRKRSDFAHVTKNKDFRHINRFRPMKRNRFREERLNATLTKQKTVPPLRKVKESGAAQLQALNEINNFKGKRTRETHGIPSRAKKCSFEQRLVPSQRVIATRPRSVSSSNTDADFKHRIEGLSSAKIQSSVTNSRVSSGPSTNKPVETSTVAKLGPESRSVTTTDVAFGPNKDTMPTGKLQMMAVPLSRSGQRSNQILELVAKKKIFVGSNQNENLPSMKSKCIPTENDSSIIYQSGIKHRPRVLDPEQKVYFPEAEASSSLKSSPMKNSVSVIANKEEATCRLGASTTQANMRSSSNLKQAKRVTWDPETKSPQTADTKQRTNISAKTKRSFAHSGLLTESVISPTKDSVAYSAVVVTEVQNRDQRNSQAQTDQPTRSDAAPCVGHDTWVAHASGPRGTSTAPTASVVTNDVKSLGDNVGTADEKGDFCHPPFSAFHITDDVRTAFETHLHVYFYRKNSSMQSHPSLVRRARARGDCNSCDYDNRTHQGGSQ